jgi:membrane-bound lytic murein transglycosylase
MNFPFFAIIFTALSLTPTTNSKHTDRSTNLYNYTSYSKDKKKNETSRYLPTREEIIENSSSQKSILHIKTGTHTLIPMQQKLPKCLMNKKS